MKKVAFDTSFLIRLLDQNGDDHQEAKDYFLYYTTEDFQLYLSTVVVAEYGIKENVQKVYALGTFRMMSFSREDAEMTAQFFNLLNPKRKELDLSRRCVWNDGKILGQAHQRKMDYFVSSDRKAKSKVETIQKKIELSFEFVDATIPLNILN